MDMCWRVTFRRRPSGDFWNNDRPPSDWPFPACPPDRREWKGGTSKPYEVILFGKTGRQLFMRFVGVENAG
jgi:hypothetical protein